MGLTAANVKGGLLIAIDGVRYSTFSDTLADIASGAKEANQKVSLHYAAGPRGNTVRNLIVDEEPEQGSDGRP